MYTWLVPHLYKINGMWNEWMNEWTRHAVVCHQYGWSDSTKTPAAGIAIVTEPRLMWQVGIIGDNQYFLQLEGWRLKCLAQPFFSGHVGVSNPRTFSNTATVVCTEGKDGVPSTYVAATSGWSEDEHFASIMSMRYEDRQVWQTRAEGCHLKWRGIYGFTPAVPVCIINFNNVFRFIKNSI